jgi:hypothetical protein
MLTTEITEDKVSVGSVPSVVFVYEQVDNAVANRLATGTSQNHENEAGPEYGPRHFAH